VRLGHTIHHAALAFIGGHGVTVSGAHRRHRGAFYAKVGVVVGQKHIAHASNAGAGLVARDVDEHL